MPWRDKDRGDAVFGSQYHTHLLLAVDERFHAAPPGSRLSVGADKQAFGASKRRISSHNPRWLAIPKRRGWAMPCPSHIRQSGITGNFSQAWSTAGHSRKESKPGWWERHLCCGCG